MYSLDSMKQINKIPYNGRNVVSLFSGCGGSSLGYRMSGYKVLYANEFVENAIEVYKLNFKNTYVDPRDIRTISPKEILKIIAMKKYELDLLDGSPPCASFSVAGLLDKAWGKVKNYSGKKQRTDDLFFEYARILEGLMPKCFITENVKGLSIGRSKKKLGSLCSRNIFFDESDELNKNILDVFRSIGYNVKAQVLNASHYGVPQSRERLFIIGIRDDFDIVPTFPKEQNRIYTVSDAFENVDNSNFDMKSLEYNSGTLTHKLCSKMKQGEQASKYHENGHKFSMIRLEMNKPSPTLTTKHEDFVHPLEDRRLSIPEAKMLQSLPNDFKLIGSNSKQFERIGRSVPPLLMKSLSGHFYKHFFERIGKKK